MLHPIALVQGWESLAEAYLSGQQQQTLTIWPAQAARCRGVRDSLSRVSSWVCMPISVSMRCRSPVFAAVCRSMELPNLICYCFAGREVASVLGLEEEKFVANGIQREWKGVVSVEAPQGAQTVPGWRPHRTHQPWSLFKTGSIRTEQNTNHKCGNQLQESPQHQTGSPLLQRGTTGASGKSCGGT